MKTLSFLFLWCISMVSLPQMTVSGKVVDEKGDPVPYVTVSFRSQTAPSRMEGTFTLEDGRFTLQIPADRYLIGFQMIGYEKVSIEKQVTEDLDLGMVTMKENVEELEEVVVRAERSYIENDLGKKTLHIGADLANAGSTAVDALESLPSVTIAARGTINVRGSENVIIYVNGRETKRDPKSLQFISADALQKIELITNPSAKYDAEGIAGIINLVYAKSRSTKLELFASVSTPFRRSFGLNTSISSDNFTFYLNASDRRSRFRVSEDQMRLTPFDSLRRYDNRISSKGKGITREVNAGVSYEPDTTFSMGLEISYLRWDDEADQFQNGIFAYENGARSIMELLNDGVEIEDELSFTLSSERKFKGGQSLKFQLTAGGEDEINRTQFNKENADVSDTPIQQSIRSSDETEDQRYYQAKLDYEIPLMKDLTIAAGVVADVFDINVDQELEFQESASIANRFKIEMDKYAGYVVMEDKRKRFEYAIGLRYEQFSSTSLQKATDSTFTQQFNNLFPSLSWRYAIGSKGHSLGFNFTRRINRPSFWEVSPFLSYTDPLNLETGNPYLRPEFGYLYELTYSITTGKLGLDLTGFRRTTQDVIQQVTSPLNENALLVTFDNLGTRHDDGLEMNATYELSNAVSLEASGSTYRTLFKEKQSEVFFNGRWNWQSRLKQRFRFDNWTIDLTQYYRAPRFGAQSTDLSQYYLNASVQKSFLEKRGNVTLTLRDVFNTRIFSEEVVGENFVLENNYKFQTRVFTLSLRYKLVD
ncbi:MAG: outer membrane beta-barrel family protein [Bacteroidota bacterium]